MKKILLAIGILSMLTIWAEPAQAKRKAPAWGNSSLGERCSEDTDCASRECSAQKRCVRRNYKKHPILGRGKKCWFNGDCRSGRCSGVFTRRCE